MERAVIIRDHIFWGIVCCDVDPNSEGAFDQVDGLLKSIYSGTKNGWRTLRENDNLHDRSWDDVKPVGCDDFESRWHYMIVV
jgi:hypothetical protein